MEGDRVAPRARRVATCCLLLANLLPLLGLLPLVHRSSAGTVTVHDLLPMLAAPTVLVVALGSGRVVLALQAFAIVAVPVVAFVDAPHPFSSRLLQTVSVVTALVLAALLVRRMRTFLASYLRDLSRASVTDALTGALNRRGVTRRLSEISAAARAAGECVGIALIDLDHFKRINDTFGHDVGDRVLRAVAQSAMAVVGPRDAVARTGGEELLLVTVGDALPASERLAVALRARQHAPEVTVSIGVTTAQVDECADVSSWRAAVARADDALYRAKRLGRNRIEVADAGARDGACAGGEPAVREPAGAPSAGSAGPDGAPPAAFAGMDARRTVRAGHERATTRDGTVTHLRPVTHRDRVLYQAIVIVALLLGASAAVDEFLYARVSPMRSFGLLAVGTAIAGAMLWWLGTVRVARRLLPAVAVATALQLVMAFLAPTPSRISVLFVMLLVGLAVVSYWTRAVLVAQLIATGLACVGAAWTQHRPVIWVVIVAATMAASLLTTLAVVGAHRRRIETVERESYWRSVTDPLTGLGNRRAVDAAHHQWRSGVVLIADVDGFKQLNDAHGHAHGDQVLRSIGLALDALVRELGPGAQAFRLGGDEFVVAVPRVDAGGRSSAARAMSRLSDQVRARLAALVPAVSVTVGTSWWPSAKSAGLWDALSQADLQMIELKRSRGEVTRDPS